MARVFRRFAMVLFVGSILLAAEAKSRAFLNPICDPHGPCFCGGYSCSCPDFEDCSVQYPSFCDDFRDLCGNVAGSYVTYCDPGDQQTPCMGICWCEFGGEGQCGENGNFCTLITAQAPLGAQSVLPH